MSHEQTSIEKFMKWLVDERWDLSDPVPIRTLYTEFVAVSGSEEAYHRKIYNSIKARLKAKNILDKFTVPQIAHIHFLLSVPVDKKVKPVMETCGKLVLDQDGHRINFFKSFDGKVWSGVHRKWHGTSKKVADEDEVVLPKKKRLTHEEEEEQKNEEMRQQNLQFQRRMEEDIQLHKREEEKEKERLGMLNVELAHVNFDKEMEMRLEARHGDMEVKKEDFENFEQDFEAGFPGDFAQENDYGRNEEVEKPDVHLTPVVVQELNTQQGEPMNEDSHRQQLTAPIPPISSESSVNAQAPVTAISSVEFLKALKKIAFNCDLSDEFKKIEAEEAKFQNKNLQIPISQVLFDFGGYLAEINHALKASDQQEGVSAGLYLGALNLFVLKLGSMDPISQKIKELEKSGNKNISMEIIRGHIAALLKLAVQEV